MKALSIRQPWAWLIVQGFKTVENRSWRTHYRGPILIHASQGMTRDEYHFACSIARAAGMKNLPARDRLLRGGIIGRAHLVDCVPHHDSPYFFGPNGFVLENPEPLKFFRMPGKLSLFEVDDHILDFWNDNN